MNASELFVRALENEGVEVIYGVPGEENLDFLEALRASPIELILTRHEQGAAFMAATYGRLTGKAGVCLATLGPGATNFVTPGAYAQLGAMPLLMITGQKPIKHSKQGQFQIVDVVNMMKPITKYAKQIVSVDMIPSMVREAFRQAEEERPGATLLELPEDIAAEMVEADTAPVFTKSHVHRPIADDRIIHEAADMIRAAKFPLLLFGAGANRKRIRTALCDFAKETGIYFFNTQMGKGCVSENRRQFIGTAALSDNDYIHCAIERSDLIINVGHDVVEKPPFFMEHGGKEVIHINFNSAIVDNVYFPQLEVVGDIASTVERLSKELGVMEHDYSYFSRVKEALYTRIDADAKFDCFPMKPQRFVADVRKAMPSDGIIALDNGVYKVWFARNYLAEEPNTVLLDNALATMGAGLPSAMEAARLYPTRKVMAICGDGGFMMNSQELETAVRLKLNLVILVLNDGSYGMIRWKQYGMGYKDYGLEFNNPDFVMYAQSYGAKGHRVTSTESFVPLIHQCYEEGGVHLIDLPVDYSENTKVLIDELKEKGMYFMMDDTKKLLSVHSPFDGRLIEQLPMQNAQDAQAMLNAASALFEDRDVWLAPHARMAILKKLAGLVEQEAEDFAMLIAKEGGKPLTDARIEVARAIEGIHLAVKELSHVMRGEEIPMGHTLASVGRIAHTTYEPIGVVVAVSAFNHPLNLIVHQVVPAIAVGCPVIVKPAETTPLSCARFVTLVHEAGLSKDWCQLCVCENAVAETLVTSDQISFFTFIGSAKVGWWLKSKLAPGVRCALEHGGVAPAIVDKTADMAKTIPSLLKGGFYHAGQVCVSVQRIFVDEVIVADFVHALTDAAKQLNVGDPTLVETEVGPLILPREVDRVHAWVTEAVEQGATLLTGGEKLSDTTYAPTVLLNPSHYAKVSTMEVFGPVVCVYAYENYRTAIKDANSLDVAFQAAVYTEDLGFANSCIKYLDATAVMVNDHTAFRVDWMPFAGRKSSGYGVGGIGYTMHDMIQIKMTVIKDN